MSADSQPSQEPTHRSLAELERGLSHVLDSPAETGSLEMIVRRPRTNARHVLQEGELTAEAGLVGDIWAARRVGYVTEDGNPDPDAQLTLTNSRFADLVAGSRERWPLTGDQLFVDLDLSAENLPPGTRLRIGNAVIEVTELPHTGCKKYAHRFGQDALRFTATPANRKHHLRGIYARVVEAGAVRQGDTLHKVDC